MIRERPRSAEEAREFINGERLSLSLHANFRYAETQTRRHIQGERIVTVALC